MQMTEKTRHPVVPPSTRGGVASFDFRRPTKFSREHMRSVEAIHEVFARNLGSSLSHLLRTAVTLEAFSTDQITYEDYIRSLPTPSVISTLTLEPLPGTIVVELSPQLSLSFVDRVLGGAGGASPMRRPTDIETGILLELMAPLGPALSEALEPVAEVEGRLLGVEYNPRFVQVVSPTDMVLLLSYSVSVSGHPGTEGILSVCYPFPTLEPALDRLERRIQVEGRIEATGEAPTRPFGSLVPEFDVPLAIRLRTSAVPAAELEGLAVGDVIRLDHRIDEPALGQIGDRTVVRARLGRRGRRLAVQIAEWNRS